MEIGLTATSGCRYRAGCPCPGRTQGTVEMWIVRPSCGASCRKCRLRSIAATLGVGANSGRTPSPLTHTASGLVFARYGRRPRQEREGAYLLPKKKIRTESPNISGEKSCLHSEYSDSPL